MTALGRSLAPLAWLGRQGAWPLALSLAGGFALPVLAEPLRPLLAPLVVALLAIAFARVQSGALAASAGRWRFLVSAMLWLLLGLPFLAALAVRTSGLAEAAPDLATIIVAGLGSSPIVSTPAYALMLGLPVGPVLAILVAGMTLLPLTLPLVLSLAFDGGLDVAALPLALRLAGLLLAAGLLSIGLRRALGPDRLMTNGPVLDGVSHVLLFLLAVVLIGALSADLLARPVATLGLAGLCCLVTFGAMALTALVARILPGVAPQDRPGLCMVAGLRNLAIVLAAVPGLGPQAVAYVGAAQVPIYLAPIVLGFVRRRMGRSRLDRTGAA